MKVQQKTTKIDYPLQPKAKKQDTHSSILDKYKNKTTQLKSSNEEKLLQEKFETTQLAEQEEALQQKPNNTGLPGNLKAGIEKLSGYSMDDVKVHYNSSQPATLQAHAYAQGTDIHIASGQEKYLPHEAWHVVQQKQGRVKPTMQLQGININDQEGLEKEANMMGAKAINIPILSGMTEFDTILTQSSYMNYNQLQRQEIETFGGTFKTIEYIMTDHISKEEGQKGVGCKMKLEFNANDTIDCDNIGLVQTTTPTVKKGQTSHENYAASRGLARATTDIVEDDTVEKARYLDRTDKNVHPIFGAQNPLNEPNIVPESFHSTEDKLGTHKLNEFGRVEVNKPATLLDKPGRDWNEGWTVIQSFETTSICLDGPMKGDYLGSVEWGYRYGPENQGTTTLPFRKINDGVPSKKFMEAAVNWNKSRIPLSIDEEINTIPLPENERIGTAEALSLPHRKYMLDQIETLSQNSILDLLKDPVFSQHSKQLLWRKLYNLMSVDSKIFAKSWLNVYDSHKTLESMLLKLRDQHAKQNWEVQQWVLDDSIRKLINVVEPNQVNVQDLIKLLETENDKAVLFCLNIDWVEKSIDNGKHFTVPFKLLNSQAKEIE